MRDPQATKAAILRAAALVLAEQGAESLTLDEVARRASVSKGGVLHHFPNKEALVKAAFANDLDHFDAEVEKLRQQDPEPVGAYTRAYLRTCAATVGYPVNEVLAFFYQFRSAKATIELVRTYKQRWMERVEQDGLDPVVANIVRYASDGLWLEGTLGEAKPACYQQVFTTLLDMTRARVQSGPSEAA